MSTQKDRKSEKSADNPLTPYNTSVAEISPGIYAIGANPAKADVPDDIDSDLKLNHEKTDGFWELLFWILSIFTGHYLNLTES